jgi:hypothetical protein
MSDSQTQEPEVDWRKWTIDHARLVRAFEPATFALDADEQAPLLAAGALIMAATQMIDELFQDIETLARNGSGSITDSEVPTSSSRTFRSDSPANTTAASPAISTLRPSW